MRASFCIWVARNSKVWSPDIDLIETTHPPVKARKKGKEKGTSDSLKKVNTTSCRNHQSHQPGTEPPKSNEASTYHAGFINKGNTCYANSIFTSINCHSGPVVPVAFRILSSFTISLSPYH